MKFRAVFDASVLVAAMSSRDGASFALVSGLPHAAYELTISVALYTEWQTVLTREEHLPTGATSEDALAFLRYLASLSHLQEVHYLWRPVSHVIGRDLLVECAVGSGAKYIVTHNVRDFQGPSGVDTHQRIRELSIEVVTPGAFLNSLRNLL